MLNTILFAIVIVLVLVNLPLAYKLGKREGELNEYRHSRKEIKEILENV